MKRSIYKVFKNLNLLLLISFLTAIILFAFVAEQYYSYEKVQSLEKQKSILSKIITSKSKMTFIDFNANISTINNAINKLQKQSQYNYISIYITKNHAEYIKGLTTLHQSVQKFDKQARKHFRAQNNEPLFMKKSLLLQPRKTFSLINRLIIKNISYDHSSFNIFSKIFLFLLFTLLLSNIWQRKRLNSIYESISYLYSKDPKKNKKILLYQEIDAINMRMQRKDKVTDNPAMRDPVTELQNKKGMLQTYSTRKTVNDNNFSSLTILEIDNFSASNRVFSQDFTQEILKKVAYSISLHEHANDIIARTDYNQFTLILSRPSKEQLFKDVEIIRESISSMKIASPEKEALTITVSGGFIMKSNHSPLDESIRKATELLKSAKNAGINKILQTKDLPKV